MLRSSHPVVKVRRGLDPVLRSVACTSLLSALSRSSTFAVVSGACLRRFS